MRFIPAVSPVQIQVPLPLPPGTYRVVRPGSQKFNGPLVKWLRHGPFTAVTWVRIPYGSPSHRTPVCAASYGRTREYRNGGLAQLVRAPASHAGGHWFESSSLHQTVPDFLRNQELFFCFAVKKLRQIFHFFADQYETLLIVLLFEHSTFNSRIPLTSLVLGP